MACRSSSPRHRARAVPPRTSVSPLQGVFIGALVSDDALVAQVLAAAGIMLLAFQFFVYPRLIERVGITTVQHTATAVASLFALLLPYTGLLTWDGTILMVASVIVLAVGFSAQAAVSSADDTARSSRRSIPPPARSSSRRLKLSDS